MPARRRRRASRRRWSRPGLPWTAQAARSRGPTFLASGLSAEPRRAPLRRRPTCTTPSTRRPSQGRRPRRRTRRSASRATVPPSPPGKPCEPPTRSRGRRPRPAGERLRDVGRDDQQSRSRHRSHRRDAPGRRLGGELGPPTQVARGERVAGAGRVDDVRRQRRRARPGPTVHRPRTRRRRASRPRCRPELADHVPFVLRREGDRRAQSLAAALRNIVDPGRGARRSIEETSRLIRAPASPRSRQPRAPLPVAASASSAVPATWSDSQPANRPARARARGQARRDAAVREHRLAGRPSRDRHDGCPCSLPRSPAGHSTRASAAPPRGGGRRRLLPACSRRAPCLRARPPTPRRWRPGRRRRRGRARTCRCPRDRLVEAHHDVEQHVAERADHGG